MIKLILSLTILLTSVIALSSNVYASDSERPVEKPTTYKGSSNEKSTSTEKSQYQAGSGSVKHTDNDNIKNEQDEAEHAGSGTEKPKSTYKGSGTERR